MSAWETSYAERNDKSPFRHKSARKRPLLRSPGSRVPARESVLPAPAFPDHSHERVRQDSTSEGKLPARADGTEFEIGAQRAHGEWMILTHDGDRGRRKAVWESETLRILYFCIWTAPSVQRAPRGASYLKRFPDHACSGVPCCGRLSHYARMSTRGWQAAVVFGRERGPTTTFNSLLRAPGAWRAALP